jgi:hypothetical protein
MVARQAERRGRWAALQAGRHEQRGQAEGEGQRATRKAEGGVGAGLSWWTAVIFYKRTPSLDGD